MGSSPVETPTPCPAVPMKEWIAQGDEGGECRPCLLVPVTQWYISELQERGHQKEAEELVSRVEAVEQGDGDEVALAEALDSAKANAPDELAARLKEFDCAAQSWKSEEEGGELDGETESPGD